MMPIPLLTVCSLDPVLRDATVAGLLCDVPGALVLRHDLEPDGLMRRVVYDLDGPREQAEIDLADSCRVCALRADVIATLRRLVVRAPDPPAVVILALPVAVSARPLLRALQPRHEPAAVPGLEVTGVLGAIDAATFTADLLGDDLLAERDLQTSPEDRRSVGEVVAQLVEYADVLVSDRPAPAIASEVLAHLVGPDVTLLPVNAIDPAPLLQLRRHIDDPRGDFRRVDATRTADTDRVWTLELESWRPMHPDRLQESIQALGTGPIRGRGVFWLATRPHLMAAWDGAGGQLSIGGTGTWDSTERRSRLVITGVDHDPAPVRAAFDRALLTDRELSRGLHWWATRQDGFDPWLGNGRLPA